MKLRYGALLLLVVLINCPKKYTPGIKKIEVTYCGSLYEDIHRDRPILAGIKDLPGVTLGHLNTDPPILAVILGKLGIFELLDETGIDYVIADTSLTHITNVQFFVIHYPMGYAIENYAGIRFAIFVKNKDSLTIDEEVKLTIVNQRSDVLWRVDNAFLSSPPHRIDFYIKDRGLADTSISTITINPDSVLQPKIHDIARRLDQVLARKISHEKETLNEYILSTSAASAGVNIVLYPAHLFKDTAPTDSITVHDLITHVAYHERFRSDFLSKDKVLELTTSKGYRVWGQLSEANRALIPDVHGQTLYELCFPEQVLEP